MYADQQEHDIRYLFDTSKAYKHILVLPEQKINKLYLLSISIYSFYSLGHNGNTRYITNT